MSGISHLFNAVMNVYTITDGQSGTGGAEETEVLKHENVPCLIEELRASERVILGRDGVDADHMIYAETDKAIIEKDRIKIGARTFDVEYPDDPQGRGHHLEIAVKEKR